MIFIIRKKYKSIIINVIIMFILEFKKIYVQIKENILLKTTNNS